MGSRWNGKVKGLNSIRKKRETKRVSFIIPAPGADNPFDCRIPDFDEHLGSRGPRPPGQAQLYSPEQIYNYKSQWARYERALDLFPDSVEERGKTLVYKYHSCDAPGGYWEVTLQASATFVKMGQVLNIICPTPYQLTDGESDGEEFIWQQLSGTRSVKIEPSNTLNPIFTLENFCNLGSGCDDGTGLPIILKVSVVGQPELFDTLTIYNTPTSTNWGNSFASQNTISPCRTVETITPAPAYPQLAYANTGEPIALTWELPSCDREFVVKTVWQQNINGTYVDIEEFPVGAEHFIDVEVNQYFRVQAYFNVYGRRYTTTSKPITFDLFGSSRQVFGDDSQHGTAFASSRQSFNKIPLGVVVFDYGDSHSGSAFAASRQASAKTPLSVKVLENSDSHSGSAVAFSRQAYTKVQQSGIVIG